MSELIVVSSEKPLSHTLGVFSSVVSVHGEKNFVYTITLLAERPILVPKLAEYEKDAKRLQGLLRQLLPSQTYEKLGQLISREVSANVWKSFTSESNCATGCTDSGSKGD